MKKILTLAALAMVLSAHKCKEGEATGSSSASLMSTKWMLQSLNGKALELAGGSQRPWLQMADGEKMSGFGGCNQLNGSYKLDGQRLGFGPIMSTKMYCEQTSGMEKNFLTALGGVDAYQLDGGKLKLMQGTTEVAAFAAGN